MDKLKEDNKLKKEKERKENPSLDSASEKKISNRSQRIQLEDPNAGECKDYRNTFKNSCLDSWVKHFEIQRFGERAMKDHGMMLNDPNAGSQDVIMTDKKPSNKTGSSGTQVKTTENRALV